MKTLVFTTVYPNDAQPVHGLFVAQRIRHVAAREEVRVVAPIPWRRAQWATASASGRPADANVRHPTFYYLPGLFKSLDWLFLAISAIPEITRLRRTFDFDLLDAHFGYPDGVAAAFLGWWFQRPVVVTLRGSELVMVRFPLRRRALQGALRRAAAVIVVSKELGRLAASLGVDASVIHHIPNGIDASVFTPKNRDVARAEIGVDAGSRLIMSAGHLLPGKGFHHVVAALPSLISEFPTLRFAIVGGLTNVTGSDTYEKSLHDLVAELRLESHVVFTGTVTPERMAAWMSAADAFVLATAREGSPNVVWEAMACGCPIVATRVADLPDVLTAERGVTIERADDIPALGAAIATALRNRWDREQIRAYMARRTWSTVGEEVRATWARAIIR